MLCAVCMSMFQNSAMSGPHHKDHERLAAAAKNGCRICYYLSPKFPSDNLKPLEYGLKWANSWALHWEIYFYETSSGNSMSIDDRARTHTDRLVFVDVSSSSDTDTPSGYNEFLDLVAADLGSDPTRVRTDFPPLRDIPDNTGHEDVARVAKDWLQTCKDHHNCGSASSPQDAGWYPKRFIHVGDKQQSPRLIISENETPEGSYAALSHCWGENPDFLMLTSDTLSDFCREIQLQHLPASFRDAIITCRRMGIPYIWIDSLCILQAGDGSHEDWLLHSEEMHRVYQNCYLNISIDVSKNPHGGAFRSRDPTYLQDCYLWTPFLTAPHQLADAEEQSKFRNLCSIFTRDDFSFVRLDLPISKRAWVFQERLLAPRTLHFTLDRISWECERSRNLTEYLPKGAGNDEWAGFDCLYQSAYSIQEQGDVFAFYYDFVLPYMKRQLSHPDEDKLVAFAAVARRCTSWFRSEYCAGIFRSTMPQGLLWEAFPVDSMKRSKVYRAPSWSWANMDCSVNFDVFEHKPIVIFADIVDVAVELVDPKNQFGQVKSGSLTLTGPLIASEALVPREHNSEGVLPEGRFGRAGYQDIQTMLGHTLGITADTANLWNEIERKPWLIAQENMYFLAILETSEYPRTCGLLLQKNNNGSFTRAGYWEAGTGFVSKHAHATCQFRSENITIV
ncbi:heterokaryon incompatibility protein-domain-containing protein [Fusarium oxysporum Fo47]|uniref:Uncharacterized protein n=1 Tax=Fusarium oxysporum Fo47 TaxID=660027 RepID=W9JG83_FUSOX|nr:heterokaryon incompatibility protein-domain-containing protein [Fusarium oxysporum Fo47]EWZ28468.1 hypothetical protein FOZG_17861 [Fusarium oxysporum Fo47]QKD56938.1 heterokaryon incompatibility protein-domain-containing protein [Fusarium oxysporum Fo47]